MPLLLLQDEEWWNINFHYNEVMKLETWNFAYSVPSFTFRHSHHLVWHICRILLWPSKSLKVNLFWYLLMWSLTCWMLHAEYKSMLWSFEDQLYLNHNQAQQMGQDRLVGVQWWSQVMMIIKYKKCDTLIAIILSGFIIWVRYQNSQCRF